MADNEYSIADEESRLSALDNLALLDTVPEERFDRIVRLAMALMDMPYAYINLVDKERLWSKATYNSAPYESAREQSICQFTIRQRLPTIIEDTLKEERVVHLNYVVNNPKFRCYLGIPLFHEGHVVGALCALDIRPRKITAQHVNLLTDLAAIVETEFSRAQLELKSHGLRLQKKAWRDLSTQLQTKDQLSGLRNQALELVAQGTPIKSIFHDMIAGVEREFPDMICSILLLNTQGTRVERCFGPSLVDAYNKALIGLEIGEGVGSCGTAAIRGERVVVADIYNHPYWAPFVDLAKIADIRSCWSEPILDSEGKVLGTFAIYHRVVCEPVEIEYRLIEQSAYLASIAIERDRANKLIWQQANYDALTGLPNRELSAVHINVAINNSARNCQKFALMFLDLDRFKEVNDTLGHDVGDMLLVEAARRIESCVRASDSVARLGGDEFVVLLNNVDGQKGVEKVAKQIMQQLTQSFSLKNDIAHVSASIGITFFPDDGDNIDVLMKNADQAMYRAKELGRDRFDYFTEDMREEANERRLLTEDLRLAISNDELLLHYQPIIDTKNSCIKYAEALLRWQHPTRGMLYPEDFIELSEDTGLIFPLTEWVLKQAMNQSKEWSELTGHVFKICVNTSLRQYTDSGRHSNGWLKVLEKNQSMASHLILEISESLLVDPASEVTDKIELLKGYGVQFAIDDFGTGYSSLAYIKQFKIDYFKIDKMFIAGLSDSDNGQLLCEAILAMAKTLGTRVVAEGIEYSQQLEVLQDIGCELGQGYYLSYPMKPCKLTDQLIAFSNNS